MKFVATIRRHKAGEYRSFYLTIPAHIFKEGYVVKVGDIWEVELKKRVFEGKEAKNGNRTL